LAGNASVIPFYPAEDQNLRQELADKRDSGLNLAYRGDIDIRTRRAQLEGGECQMAHMPIHAIQAWGGAPQRKDVCDLRAAKLRANQAIGYAEILTSVL
jgi:hypothetical protein